MKPGGDEPPAKGDVWNWYDFWFFGENPKGTPDSIQVWKGTNTEPITRIGHAWRSSSGSWGLFLFQKKKERLPWFIGYHSDVENMADYLNDNHR